MPEEQDADVERRSSAELVAMVLRSRAPAHALLEHIGGIEPLAKADAFEIAACLAHDGVPRDGARTRHHHQRRRPTRAVMRTAHALAAAFELGRRVEVARVALPLRLTSPADVAKWATPRLVTNAHEELWMLALDGRGHLRAARCVARGGLHGAAVRASDPLRAALRVDASAFVLVHNHPSGDPTPSKEDVTLTAHVARAGQAAGVPLLDHVVVAREGFACVPLPDLDAADAPHNRTPSTAPNGF